MLLFRSGLVLHFLGFVAARGEPSQARTLALSDLPWDDLEAMLDPSTVLSDVGNPKEVYDKECLAVVERGLENPGLGYHYEMKDQASGICVANYLCGLTNCGLDPNDDTTFVGEWVGAILTDPTYRYEPFDPSNNPQYNLPSKVLFPQVAGDVVSAIKFAKEHSVELSVKNSGHSYTGASTKKDTLHLNMRSYQKHSSKGPIVCQQDDTTIDDALNNQPCKLALARNKPAVIHVGGGENWNMVYGNVKAYNEQQDTYMYHAVGGSAGSVSPMGWTWQGGLAGNMGGRMYGFGVDQVLQIEMILPSGLHIKFGPTEWTDNPDAIYPKTTKVSGVCFEEDTETWGACQEDVNFDDLWFALRGGLGGSWGVVLSVFLQLHPHQPLEILFGLTCESFMVTPVARDIYMRFILDYYFDPSELGVSKDDSIKCGAATELFRSYCYGEGAGDLFLTTWQNYISGHNETLQEELTIEQVNSYAGCFFKAEVNDKTDIFQIEEGPYKGRAADDPLNEVGTLPIQNILIPKKWILDNKDKAVSLMGANYFVTAANFPTGSGATAMYFAFGGVEASDQANALSEAHRNAGFMLMTQMNVPSDVLGFPIPPILASFYSELLPEMYDMTDSNSFPGYYGSNHAGQASLGPLSSNWTQSCPPDWTEKERDDKCISLQEAIFGTELLDRLEAIKEAIDPHYMFDCNRCIGNNRAITSQPEPGDDDDSNSGVTTTTTASFLFTGAAALVSLLIVF